MKSEKDVVSVVIVNWNGKRWLEECISSLIVQTNSTIEIIVVDNASTDGSIAYLKQNFPNVKILQNKTNLGFPKANNQGVRASVGDYLLLLNNDTWMEKDFIEKMLMFYKKNTFAVISPTEKRYFNDAAFKQNTTIDVTGSPAYYTDSRKFKNAFFMSVCYFCTKKIYYDTLGLDEDYFAYYEDVDWFWRMNLLGKKYAYVNNVFIHHAGAGSTGSGLKYNIFLWRNQNTLQTLLKNYSALTLVLVLPVYFLQNVLELLFFLVLLKPTIAYSYVQGWVFNIQHLRNTLKKRRWVQKNRIVSDFVIFKRMYTGSGKLLLLRDYLGLK